MTAYCIANKFMCEACRDSRSIRCCAECRNSLRFDTTIHIVDRLPVCDDCYQGVPIKEPETL